MPMMLPLPSAAPIGRRHLRPAAGRCAKIDDLLARLQKMIALVDLDQLERGAGAQTLPLGLARHKDH